MSFFPAATASSRSTRSTVPSAPSAGPPTYTTSEPAAGEDESGCGVSVLAPAMPSTSRTASTAPLSAFGASTSVTSAGTATGRPATTCCCGRGKTCGSLTLPSGVCGAEPATSAAAYEAAGDGGEAYEAGAATSSPPTTAAAESVAATCNVRRRGEGMRTSPVPLTVPRSARTDASSGSVPLKSAIMRSAARGANCRAVRAVARRAASAAGWYSTSRSAALCSNCCLSLRPATTDTRDCTGASSR